MGAPRRELPGRPAVVAALAGCLALAAATTARAGDDFGGDSVIFARGSSLYRVDAQGKDEVEIAQLAARVAVRALRSDAGGKVLLADLAGTWAWMPLDGSARSLTALPCADGPAQLAEDGSVVLCRAPKPPDRSILVPLGGPPGKLAPLDIPPGSARIVGTGAEQRLVWADARGVWTAPASNPKHKTRAAQGVPLRGFLPSPDGARAIGVYADQVYSDAHQTRPAEVLMTLALDGQGARRRAIQGGVAVEWSHDGQWVLLQDGASACIMRASGGQYKCWRGYTAASLSSDGRWGLVLGSRDSSRNPPRAAARSARKAPARPAPASARPTPAPPARRDGDLAGKPDDGDRPTGGDKPWDNLDEPSGEPEAGEAPPADDDVSVAPPSGPLSLYRVRLEGAFTDRPILLVKDVDGAAVWVPDSP